MKHFNAIQPTSSYREVNFTLDDFGSHEPKPRSFQELFSGFCYPTNALPAAGSLQSTAPGFWCLQWRTWQERHPRSRMGSLKDCSRQSCGSVAVVESFPPKAFPLYPIGTLVPTMRHSPEVCLSSWEGPTSVSSIHQRTIPPELLRVILLVANLLVTILKARTYGSFSTSSIKSLQHWNQLYFSFHASKLFWLFSMPYAAEHLPSAFILWASVFRRVVSHTRRRTDNWPFHQYSEHINEPGFLRDILGACLCWKFTLVSQFSGLK